MTNAELNLAIAKLAYPNENPQMEIELYGNLSDAVIVDISGLREDYCNNWNDLMPLVVEHRISLFDLGHREHIWQATTQGEEFLDTVNKNPQRALAECLLKVLEAKQ